MKKTYDVFISHASCDTHLARELRDILVKNNFSVFLAADENRPPLNCAKEWKEEMTSALFDSERLIFIISDPAQIKAPSQQNGCWVHYEFEAFHTLCFMKGQASDYFGIFVGDVDLNSLSDSPSIYAAVLPRQNLSVEKGQSLYSIKQAIYDRTVNAFSKNTLLLSQAHSKTADFIKAKQALDSEFSQDAIDDDLIPKMKLHYRDGDDRDVYFDSIAHTLQNSNIVVSNDEGGSGKTTLLTKLFFHFYNKFDLKSQEADNFLPIFIDAKLLSAENNLIIRYISQYLFGNETAMSERSPDEIAVKFSKDFKNSYDTPDYLLLIDGLNEVPHAQAEILEKEISELMSDKYPNVRVAVSSRGDATSFPSELFNRVEILKLNIRQINAYLGKNSIDPLSETSKLRGVLSLPMYLKLFVSTASNKIRTQGDLLSSLTNWQLEKIKGSDISQAEKAQQEFFLCHLLPCFSHRLAYFSQESSFVFKFNKNFFDMLSLSLKELFSRQYKFYFGENYFELLNVSNLKMMDDDDVGFLALEYYTKVCRILRRQPDGSYSFIHQIYRDYFAATHISNQLIIASQNDCENLENCIISQKELSTPTIRFMAQILKEKGVFFDSVKQEWNYTCNSTSTICKIFSTIRKTDLSQNKILIANLLSILKTARMGDLSNCNFDGLDLTLCDLTHCVLSRFDKNGVYPSSFNGAVINEENLIFDGCNAYINTACFVKNCIATLDSFGALKFWPIHSSSKSPVKIATGLNMPIKQMLYSEKDDCIYCACNNSIFRIEIPSQTVCAAVYRKIFETRESIREISFDQNGELLFTRGDNPFNPKPITNPDCEDTCSFKGLFAGAAINDAGDEIVFGNCMQFPVSTKNSGDYTLEKRTNFLHSMRYSGIHKYRKNQDGKWEQVHNAYHTILYSYYREIKEKIIDFGLYNYFYYRTGHHYFDFVHDIYEDRSSKFDCVFRYVLNDLEKIGGNSVFSQEQKDVLEQILQKYTKMLNDYTENNFPIMATEGKIINSLCYNKKSGKLLVSAVFDAERTKQINKKTSRLLPGERFKSNIVEIDTKTDEANFIYCVEDIHPATAVYGDGYILAYSRNSFSVFNAEGHCIRFINAVPMDKMRIFKMPDKETFVLVASGVIYEFDQNLKCVKSFENKISANVMLHKEESDGKCYLVNPQPRNDSAPRNKMDLENGARSSAKHITSIGQKNEAPVINNKSFRFSAPRLLAFQDDLLYKFIDIKNRLIICGCDFRSISGSLKSQAELLAHYGAITDSFEPADFTCVPPCEKDCDNADKDYAVFDENPPVSNDFCISKLTTDTEFALERKFTMGVDFPSHEIYTLDVTRKFDAAFINGQMSEFDKDVLKWAVKLRYFTAEMIYNLVVSKIISEPSQNFSIEEIDNHLYTVLRDKFKLLSLVNAIGLSSSLPRIYTTNKPFGDRVGQILDGKENTIPSSLERGNHISILTVNRWATKTLASFGGKADVVKMYPKIEVDYHFMGAFSSDSYLTIDGRAIIAEYMNSNKLDDIVILDKIARRCAVAKHFEKISCDNEPQKNQKPPLIILIAENEQICKEIINKSAHLFPEVKRLFTYEDLFASGREDCYFFENDGVLYKTSLEKELH